MVKKITLGLLYCFFCLSFSGNLYAVSYIRPLSDTPLSRKADTDKTRGYRIINRDFNAIYTQNLMPATFGQEFFDPNKTLLVSNLVANFVIFNDPRFPVFFVVTPRIDIRLFSAFGSPVKSPSYMPGATLYFRTNRDAYNPDFFSVSYTHHSNGIRGPTLNPNGTFNTDSGKFTTNFYTITFHNGKRTDKDDIIINRYDALGVDLYSALVGLGYSHALEGKYGFVRVNGQWIYNISRANPDPIDKGKKNFQNWQRIEFDFQYIADKYDDYSSFDFKKRLNLTLKYYYQFPFMQNVSFYVGAGYRAQDEYNIFFQDTYPYVMAGLSSGLSFGIHQK